MIEGALFALHLPKYVLISFRYQEVTVNIFHEDQVAAHIKECDALISCIGVGSALHARFRPVDVHSKTIRSIGDAMRLAGIRRFVCLTSWFTEGVCTYDFFLILAIIMIASKVVSEIAHTGTLFSTPRGWNWVFFSIYRQPFPRYRPIIKIGILGYETWPLAKVLEVAHILSFYPWGSKLSLFLLYWQPFWRYGTIFKISIFGHQIWNLKTGPTVGYVLPFYPGGRN